MDEITATEQGLTFTGYYERVWGIDRLKAIAKAIRKLYKCRVVLVGKKGGMSLYADDKYDIVNAVIEERWFIDNEAERLAKVESEYQQKIEEIKARTERARTFIAKQEEKYPELKGQPLSSIYDYIRENIDCKSVCDAVDRLFNTPIKLC